MTLSATRDPDWLEAADRWGLAERPLAGHGDREPPQHALPPGRSLQQFRLARERVVAPGGGLARRRRQRQAVRPATPRRAGAASARVGERAPRDRFTPYRRPDRLPGNL